MPYVNIKITNETVMFTLWQASSGANTFARRNNVGLHHAALAVEPEAGLFLIYENVKQATGVTIEFPPEFLSDGPAKHMICYEPSGIRIKFIWIPE